MRDEGDFSHVSANPLSIDTDGTVHDGSDVPVDVDTPRADFVPAYTHTSGREVARIRVGLEAHKIGTKHAIQDLHTP